MYVITAADQKLLQDYIIAVFGVVIAAARDNKVGKDFKQLMLSVVKNAQQFEKLTRIEVPLFQGNEEFDAANMVKEGRAIQKMLKAVVVKDKTVDWESIDMLKAASTWMKNNSDRAFVKMAGLVPQLNQPLLLQYFRSEQTDQTQFARPLQKIVRFYTGRANDLELTLEEKAKLKAKDRDKFKEYVRLRQGYNSVWSSVLRNLVIDSGQSTIDYEGAVKALAAQGISHPLPKGFKGKIDQNGRIYTSAGKRLVTRPRPEFSVKMNSNYNPSKDDSYVFTTIDDAGGTRGHIYTEDYVARMGKAKFVKVANLTEVIDSVRNRWKPWLAKDDSFDIRVVCSVVLELLFQTSARIGGKSSTEGGAGLGWLHVKNIYPQPDGGYKIIYQGKDNIRQVHRIKPVSKESKLVCKHIEAQLEGKAPKDFLWTYDLNGRIKPLLPVRINKWFSACGAPQGVSVHKLRHYNGTKLFKQLLAENEKTIFGRKNPLDQKQADAILKKLATKVGDMLGHIRTKADGTQETTGATALAAYVDPNVVADYYSRLNLRPPKSLQRVLKIVK